MCSSSLDLHRHNQVGRMRHAYQRKAIMTKEYQITKQGLADLKQELEDLISQRSVVAGRLATARSYGDLSENAEYDAAKTEQQNLEKRISDVTNIIKNSEIIQEKKSDSVGLGNTVEVSSDGKTLAYQIVGKVEADPSARKISDESPIGSRLIGKKVGDTIEVELPAGLKKYKIKKIN